MSTRQPDVTIQMSVNNCSELSGHNVQYSKSVFHSNMKWHIVVSRNRLDLDFFDGYLRVNVEAAPASQEDAHRDWSCNAVCTYRLICRTDDSKSRECTTRTLNYNQENNSWGRRLIRWNELMDKANGFVDEDDTALLQVDLQLFP